MRLRNRTIGAIAFALYILLLLWVNQEKISLSQLDLYWLQVFSGNWSPDFSTKGQEYLDHQFSFLLGSLIAVILNTVTIASLVTAAITLFVIQGQNMKYQTLFDIRDDVIIQKIMELYPESERLEMLDRVKDKIKEANLEWETKTLQVVVSDDVITRFKNTLDRNFVAK